MVREKGWEFLFCPNRKPGTFTDADGNETCIYSNGSGYYHGTDGSDGYIYSDGSGYFHGTDGSDGYIYSDGSGYYHGKNGVDARQYSDGSGYYKSVGNDYEHYDSIDELQAFPNCDEFVDLASSELLSLAGIGVSKVCDAMAMRIRAEQQRKWLKEQRRREFWIRYRKFVFLIIGCLILISSVLLMVWEFRKLIPVGCDSSMLIGENYEDVVYTLQSAGFTNIKLEESESLGIEDIGKENCVYQIYALGKNSFSKTSKLPYDIKVTVKYYSIKKIAPPVSAKEAKGRHYIEVVDSFEQVGFANIKTEASYDILKEWINDQGSVKRIEIDNETRFDTSDSFHPYAEVVIIFHDVKSKR